MKKLVLDILIIFLAAVPVFYRLGSDYINVDQPKWQNRATLFYEALSTGNFASTYQQYHPGVTIMILSGFGQKLYCAVTGNCPLASTQVLASKFATYNFFSKLPLVTVVFSLLVVSYLLLSKLGGRFLAAPFLLFLCFEPYYLANLRNLHLDAMLSASILVSFLSIATSHKIFSTRLAAMGGFISGLAILTKSSGVFSFALATIVTLVMLARAGRKSFVGYIERIAVFTLMSLLTFFVLFPAMWVAPTETLSRIIREGVIDTGAKTGHNHYINEVQIRDPGTDYYFKALKFRLTTPIVVASVASILVLLASLAKKREVTAELVVAVSLIFCGAYFMTFSYFAKKTDRYMTPIFPFLALLPGYLLYYFWTLKQKPLVIAAFVFALAFQAYTVFRLFPDFFAYYNPVFGGISKARSIIYLNQGGTAMDKVAAYLKSQNLPGTTLVGVYDEDLLDVWTDLKVVNMTIGLKRKCDYLILPLQRGNVYKTGYTKVATIKVGGEDYWRIYKRSNM